MKKKKKKHICHFSRSVSDRFGISKSLLHDSMKRVVTTLSNMADRFITWPVDDRLQIVKDRFSQIGSLPNVIGAIDGCHIPIPAPKVNHKNYRNYTIYVYTFYFDVIYCPLTLVGLVFLHPLYEIVY